MNITLPGLGSFGSVDSITSLGDGSLLVSSGASFEAIAMDGALKWKINITPQATNSLGLGSISSGPILVFPGDRVLLSYIAEQNMGGSPELQGIMMVAANNGSLVWSRLPPTSLKFWQSEPTPYEITASSGDRLLMVHEGRLVCVDVSEMR